MRLAFAATKVLSFEILIIILLSALTIKLLSASGYLLVFPDCLRRAVGVRRTRYGQGEFGESSGVRILHGYLFSW